MTFKHLRTKEISTHVNYKGKNHPTYFKLLFKNRKRKQAETCSICKWVKGLSHCLLKLAHSGNGDKMSKTVCDVTVTQCISESGGNIPIVLGQHYCCLPKILPLALGTWQQSDFPPLEVMWGQLNCFTCEMRTAGYLGPACESLLSLRKASSYCNVLSHSLDSPWLQPSEQEL